MLPFNPLLEELRLNKDCPRCHNKAVWNNYGPIVGAGYYCRTCKDDVYDAANVYGISGRQVVAKQTPLVGSSVFQPMNCDKPLCRSCLGSLASHLGALVYPNVGSIVKCVNIVGAPKLNYHSLYTIEELTMHGIRINIDGEVLEYTRCRFNLKVG